MQLDDPNRPEKKPPPYTDVNTASNEFMHMAEEIDKPMRGVNARNEKLSRAMRNFLGYCFQAETDLRASECVLVMHPGERGATSYWFQKRTEVETVGRRVTALEAELRAKNAEINMLMAEIDHLKQKAGHR